ncbi:hypothetical protein U879_02620 [Defluviimonas sp. 20V17]|nr:hypothetical protein U879_02620 [Defluviimonas sp. 20V17]
MAEPYLEIHPADAARLGLEPATIAEVTSPTGRALLRVMVSDRAAPGQVFAPIRWSGETTSAGRVDTPGRSLTERGATDRVVLATGTCRAAGRGPSPSPTSRRR